MEKEREIATKDFLPTGLSWISLPVLGLKRAEALCGSFLRVNNAAGAIPVLPLKKTSRTLSFTPFIPVL